LYVKLNSTINLSVITLKIGTLKTQSQTNAFLSQREGVRQSISDGQIRGLQLERLQPGKGKWRLRYRNAKGRRACFTIGDAPTLSLAEARELVNELRRKIAMGRDPSEEKSINRETPTFGEFIEQMYVPYIKTYKRSWQTDISLLKNHLLPRFAKRFMDDIRREDIVKLHFDRRASGAAPSTSNRLLIIMRYIFNLSIKWETAGVKTNPCAGVPLMEENNKRERYLHHDEARRLYESVCKSQNQMLKFIVPMLILTGCRKREVLDARWQDFDIERRIWRIPIAKSGKARHIPLSDGALMILRSVPHMPACPYPFANPKTGKPFCSIFMGWDHARKQAGLPDVRIHDLRHSFASLLINSGRSLYEVQKLLGHTQVKTTQRYAHLSPETLLDASNAATRAVGSMLGVSSNLMDLPLVEDKRFG